MKKVKQSTITTLNKGSKKKRLCGLFFFINDDVRDGGGVRAIQFRHNKHR